ncbi:hypothetical protein PsYK624_055380 [Phanerochaete sordida]|uniref:Uncharacterized protein n=1 Tax=Phanerochaete sordida TaxID=48140 RepID=A0A9P3G594_9APHY|nr:hypothetical protein PsYK624_055380 [Phanerochaete sordida]
MQPACELALAGAGSFQIFVPKCPPVGAQRSPLSPTSKNNSDASPLPSGPSVRRRCASTSRSRSRSRAAARTQRTDRSRDASTDSTRTIRPSEAAPRLVRTPSQIALNLGAGRPAAPETNLAAATAFSDLNNATSDDSYDATPAGEEPGAAVAGEKFKDLRLRLAGLQRSIDNASKIIERRKKIRKGVATPQSDDDAETTAVPEHENTRDDWSDDFDGDVEVAIREAVDSDGEDSEGAVAFPTLEHSPFVYAHPEVDVDVEATTEFWSPDFFQVDIECRDRYTTFWEFPKNATTWIYCNLAFADIRPQSDTARGATARVDSVLIDFWLPRNTAAKFSPDAVLEDELKRAQWHVSFDGDVLPLAELCDATKLPTNAIAIRNSWRLWNDGTAFGAKSKVIAVPLPGAILKGAECRVFRMCARAIVVAEEDALCVACPALEVRSRVVEVHVESLSMARHIEGVKLMPGWNVPPGDAE